MMMNPNSGKGTPMFCAIDISGGEAAFRRMLKTIWDIHPASFLLEGRSKEVYLKHYGSDTYEAFNAHLSCVKHDSLTKRDIFETNSGTILHSAVHDVESLYWIIMWFLIRASPVGNTESISVDYVLAAEGMLSHQIGTDKVAARTSFISYERRDWLEVIHPRCHGLIDMLVNMGSYLGKRWLQFPDISPYHAHEAVKRLLLKEIIRMMDEEDPIPIQGPRPLPKKESKDRGDSRVYTVNNGSQSNTNHSSQAGSSASQKSSKRPSQEPAENNRPKKKPRRRDGAEFDEVTQWILELQQDEAWF